MNCESHTGRNCRNCKPSGMTDEQRLRDFIVLCGVGGILEEAGVPTEEIYAEGELARIGEASVDFAFDAAKIRSLAISIVKDAVSRLLAVEVTQTGEN